MKIDTVKAFQKIVIRFWLKLRNAKCEANVNSIYGSNDTFDKINQEDCTKYYLQNIPEY